MFVMAPDFDAAPSLSAAFADHRTHTFLAALDVSSEDEPAPAGEAPAASVLSPAPGLDADRFVRRHRLGKTGVILYVAGTAATTVGAVTFLVGVLGGGLPAPVLGGAALVVAGGVTTIVGEVFIFTGGIGASQVLGENTTVGWVGVGLAIGGVAAGFTSSATGQPGIGTIASLASIGGLVCGAVELGQAGSAGRRANLISFQVAPTPNGFLVAGVF